MTYAEKLKDPRWQKKRLEILNRDKWECQLCGDKETTLQVHHKSYSGEPWNSDNKNLTTLCEHCHCVAEYYKSENITNIFPIRIFKTRLKTYSILNALSRHHTELRFRIISFEYNPDQRSVELRSFMNDDIFNAINKELKKQIKRK